MLTRIHCNDEVEAQVIQESYSTSLQLDPEVAILLQSSNLSDAHLSPQGFNIGHQNLKKLSTIYENCLECGTVPWVWFQQHTWRAATGLERP